MAHIHSVYDTDKHFTIDPATRALVNQTPEKACIMQYDHASERITFDLPAEVEGHKILDCNRVEVHYLNIDAKTQEQRTGLYEVDDLQLSPADEAVAICSWLISMNATQLVGPLYFRVTFKCVTDGNLDYSWSTAIYKGLTVSDGINCTEYVEEQYADIIAQWREDLVLSGEAIDASKAEAANYAQRAGTAADSAAGSAQRAEAAAGGVAAAAERADGAAQRAETAAGAAGDAKSAAQGSAQQAGQSATAAGNSATAAGNSATAAQGSAAEAKAAENNAQQHRQAAETAANNASTSAGAASGHAQNAAGSAQQASTSAGNAAQSAQNAASAANDAARALLEEAKQSGEFKGDPGPAYTLTDTDKNTIAAAVKASLTTETWTFTLEDGSTVTKAVYVG